MSRRSPLRVESQRPPGWLALAALCLFSWGCGGKAEDSPGTGDSDSVDGNEDQNEDEPVPLTPDQPPECYCPPDVPYGVFLKSPDGMGITYELADEALPWQCAAPEEPGVYISSCGSALSVHACHTTEGCIGVGLTDNNRYLLLTNDDTGELRLFESPDSTVEFDFSGSVLSGSFEFRENGVPRWTGTFAACTYAAEPDPTCK